MNVTVDFVSEVITCVKDKDKRVVSGDPEKIKKIYDTWIFLETQARTILTGYWLIQLLN